MYKAIEVGVWLSAESALKIDSSHYGAGLVRPTTEEVKALNEEQKAALLPFVNGRLLTVETPDWVGVLVAIDKELKKAKELAQELERDIERERARYREFLSSIEKGYYDFGTLKPRADLERYYAPNWSKNDSEAQELYAKIQKTIEEQRKEIVARADAELRYEDTDRRLAILALARVEKTGTIWDPEPKNAIEHQRREAEENTRRMEEEHKARVAEQRRLLVEAGALANTLERFDEGVLPDEERDFYLGMELFRPFAKFPKFQPLTEADVQHTEHCDKYEEDIKFKSEPYQGPYDVEQWDRLKTIRLVAKDCGDTEVSVRRHEGYCDFCGSNFTERFSVKVKQTFAGEDYELVLALD